MAQPPEGLEIALLDGLSAEQVDLFFDLATLRSYGDQEVIISEGDPGDSLFVLSSGRVRVEKATIVRRQEILTSLERGECFGELSLIDRRPRSATVRASGGAEVYAFMQDDLEPFFATHLDIHRRLLENLVKITSQRLRRVDETLVHSVYDSVILLDRSSRVLQWKQITDRHGLLEGPISPERVVGEDLFELVPHLGEGVRHKVTQAITAGDITTLRVDYEKSGGDKVYLEVTVAPSSEGGDAPGSILGIRDITETKVLENRLMQAEKLAAAGQMAAEIGHELNNFLAVISGHSDLLLTYPDIGQLPHAQKSLRAISGQVDRIERFARGLMDLGMLKSRRRRSDLNSLAQRLIDFIQGQSRFRRTRFDLDLDPDLPEVEVDPGQIQQVLLNLYANAADAMDQGAITTATRVRDDGQVVLEVADNGPGMPEDVVRQIFEAGFTTKSTGHGFGLAICHQIVENHNGTISVTSEPGQGTTFALTFSPQNGAAPK